jgi:hypothetical protein
MRADSAGWDSAGTAHAAKNVWTPVVRSETLREFDNAHSRSWTGVFAAMNIEKITVRATESGKTMEVVVFSKRANRIEVVLGEGVHSVKCELTPTRSGAAYAGSVLGREIVYERSRDQVQADIDRLNPALRKSRPR